jgi:hypothetical protein
VPADIAAIAGRSKALVYDRLFRAAAETLLPIAAGGQARGLMAHDPRHLGARIDATAGLHTWGSAMTRHPYLPMIVLGGGIALEPAPAGAGGTRWVRRRPGFLLPLRVLSRLFRRLFLSRLADAHAAGHLAFLGELELFPSPGRGPQAFDFSRVRASMRSGARWGSG